MGDIKQLAYLDDWVPRVEGPDGQTAIVVRRGESDRRKDQPCITVNRLGIKRAAAG